MLDKLIRNGKKMSFSQYKTYGEIDKVLRKIFTNNPYYWSNSPLYLDSRGELNNVVKGMITGQINIYEHTFPFIEPDENRKAEATLYNYCFDISKVRSNPLLPLVYYNAVLYMDSLGLSMCKTDNTSKIMYVQKNRYESILNVIEYQRPIFGLDDFFRHSDSFDDIEKTIHCECGTVEAYRVESGILYKNGGYIIFPFPTDDENIGRMYYFERAF